MERDFDPDDIFDTLPPINYEDLDSMFSVFGEEQNPIVPAGTIAPSTFDTQIPTNPFSVEDEQAQWFPASEERMVSTPRGEVTTPFRGIGNLTNPGPMPLSAGSYAVTPPTQTDIRPQSLMSDIPKRLITGAVKVVNVQQETDPRCQIPVQIEVPSTKLDRIWNVPRSGLSDFQIQCLVYIYQNLDTRTKSERVVMFPNSQSVPDAAKIYTSIENIILFYRINAQFNLKDIENVIVTIYTFIGTAAFCAFFAEILQIISIQYQDSFLNTFIEILMKYSQEEVPVDDVEIRDRITERLLACILNFPAINTMILLDTTKIMIMSLVQYSNINDWIQRDLGFRVFFLKKILSLLSETYQRLRTVDSSTFTAYSSTHELDLIVLFHAWNGTFDFPNYARTIQTKKQLFETQYGAGIEHACVYVTGIPNIAYGISKWSKFLVYLTRSFDKGKLGDKIQKITYGIRHSLTREIRRATSAAIATLSGINVNFIKNGGALYTPSAKDFWGPLQAQNNFYLAVITVGNFSGDVFMLPYRHILALYRKTITNPNGILSQQPTWQTIGDDFRRFGHLNIALEGDLQGISDRILNDHNSACYVLSHPNHQNEGGRGFIIPTGDEDFVKKKAHKMEGGFRSYWALRLFVPMHIRDIVLHVFTTRARQQVIKTKKAKKEWMREAGAENLIVTVSEKITASVITDLRPMMAKRFICNLINLLKEAGPFVDSTQIGVTGRVCAETCILMEEKKLHGMEYKPVIGFLRYSAKSGIHFDDSYLLHMTENVNPNKGRKGVIRFVQKDTADFLQNEQQETVASKRQKSHTSYLAIQKRGKRKHKAAGLYACYPYSEPYNSNDPDDLICYNGQKQNILTEFTVDRDVSRSRDSIESLIDFVYEHSTLHSNFEKPFNKIRKGVKNYFISFPWTFNDSFKYKDDNGYVHVLPNLFEPKVFQHQQLKCYMIPFEAIDTYIDNNFHLVHDNAWFTVDMIKLHGVNIKNHPKFTDFFTKTLNIVKIASHVDKLSYITELKKSSSHSLLAVREEIKKMDQVKDIEALKVRSIERNKLEASLLGESYELYMPLVASFLGDEFFVSNGGAEYNDVPLKNKETRRPVQTREL